MATPARRKRDAVSSVPVPASAATSDPDKTTWTRPERLALVERAQRGDKSVIPELRAMLEHHPESVKRLVNLARTARHFMTKEVAGKDDLLLPELMPQRIELLQRELEGPNPSALERLLCERVATCTLALHLLEASVVRTPAGQPVQRPPQDAEHHDRMIARAHDRLMSATLTLAKVRRLLRPEVQQVNIAQAGAQQLNIASTSGGVPTQLASPASASVPPSRSTKA